MGNDDPISLLFRALTHPARLEILEELRNGEQCVCHLEAQLGYRQAYISQQLSVLREAGLIEDRRDGWNIYYRVTQPQIFDLIEHANVVAGVSSPRQRHQAETIACPCPKCASKQSERTSAEPITLYEGRNTVC